MKYVGLELLRCTHNDALLLRFYGVKTKVCIQSQLNKNFVELRKFYS